jgi:hypothetical protein
MQTGLGTDFGLNRMPGFDRTGDFRIHFIGPLGRTFNFADANDGAGTASQMLWLARTFNQPRYQIHECALAKDRPDIFHLLWLTPNRPNSIDPLPKDALYRGIDTAFFRGSWDDPQALFVGFRGGDNAANHSHLDLGNFVMDAMGQRWALDLGPDDYNLPGYFGKERWNYYRLRTEAHNTLTLDGENQALKARAPIVAFLSAPERAFAVADLTAGYGSKVTQVRRGLAVLDRKSVLVVDEIQAAQPVNVVWNFHTKAKIDIQGARAILKQGNATLEAQIVFPNEATFAVLSANPPAPQAQQPEVSNLTVRIPEAVRQTRLCVLLVPAGVNAPKMPTVSLDAWIAEGKLNR